jgi:solute carrier family 24 (sodium/potassium/calcium exchanger), member 6
VLGVSYLSSYYCAEPTFKSLVFLALLTWLVFLFSTLGISAADFFTPNLATLSELLGMDEDVAGVTFLAFGNGSPDLFSTFSAMRAQSGTLAVGELLGAASFIVSCVVGSMCIIKPFTVEKVPFLRDVGFFTVAIAMLLGTLWDGKITIWESVSLVALYVVYVVIVIWGSWWDRRQALKRRLESEVQSDDSTPDATELNVPYVDERKPPFFSFFFFFFFFFFEKSRLRTLAQFIPLSQASPSSLQGLRPPPTRSRTLSSPVFPRARAHTLPRRASMRTLSLDYRSSVHSQMPSFSLLGALEFRQVVTSLQHQASGPSLAAFGPQHNPFAGGHYHSRVTSISPPGDMAWDAALGLALSDRDSPRIALRSPLDEDLPRVDTGDDPDRTVIPSHSSDAPSEGDNESQLLIPITRKDRFISLLGRIGHTLFPSLHQFGEKTLAGKIAAVFATPAVLALTLTLPVVVLPGEGSGLALEKSPPVTGRLIEFEEEGIERPLIAEEEAQEEDHYGKLNKWLMVTQCVLGPLLASNVLFGECLVRRHSTLFTVLSNQVKQSTMSCFSLSPL